MTIHLVKRAVMTAALVAHLACGPEATAPATAAEPEDSVAQRIDKGAAHYKRYCELCHGRDGAGYAADHAPQLRNLTFLATVTERFLWHAVEVGRSGTPMAAFGATFGGPLGRQELWELSEYLHALSPVAGAIDVDSVLVNGDPALGARVYARHCGACHGAHGEGGTGPKISEPSFLATASDGFIRYAIEHGRPSTPMRAFGEVLTPDEIAGVTRYIRTWTHTEDNTPLTGEPLPTAQQLVQNPAGQAPRLGELENGRYVTAGVLVAELARKPRIVLLDARPVSDWYKSHIEGAYPAPFYNDVTTLLPVLPNDDTWIVAYCACPHHAGDVVVDALRAAGRTHTAVLKDGFLFWLKQRYPTTFGRPK
jgi:cytochrome c oxidase cbb3-type subunit III